MASQRLRQLISSNKTFSHLFSSQRTESKPQLIPSNHLPANHTGFASQLIPFKCNLLLMCPKIWLVCRESFFLISRGKPHPSVWHWFTSTASQLDLPALCPRKQPLAHPGCIQWANTPPCLQHVRGLHAAG